MDNGPCCWNEASAQKSSRPRPTADALCRLAKLMALVEQKQEHHAPKVQNPSQPTPSCGQEFLDVTSVVSHQQKDHSLHKRNTCHPSDLDHRAYMFQPSVIIHKKPDCGLPVQPHIPSDPATPSSASLPTSSSTTTCNLCHKTLRSNAGLACHRRLIHQDSWKKVKQMKVKEFNPKLKGPLFSCRSCDRVFSNTSKLYLHRKEEHRRDLKVVKQQKSFIKSTRQRRKGETYPCLHCGKIFLHHLTRWAHFKSYSNHYQTHVANSGTSGQIQKTEKGPKVNFLQKTAKESKVVNKRIKGLKDEDGSQESGDKEELDKPDEDEQSKMEFPCPTCTEVFCTQAALLEHEEIHQPPSPSGHCSVCTGGINLPKSAESFLNQVYHCIPCGEAFLDLVDFFQHCQSHFSQDEDEEDDEDGDGDEDDDDYEYVYVYEYLNDN